MAEPSLAGPLVTICLTAYRRPTMAIQCLLSCMAQDYRPLDIDISDDSPTDDTELAIKLVPVSEGIRVRYRRNNPSLGEPKNVNSLFDQARGTYCVLIHDDDVLLPGAVAALVNGMAATPTAVAAFGTHHVLMNSGEYSLPDTERTNRDFRRVPEHAGVMADPLVSALWRQFPMNGYILETAAGRAVRYRTREEIGGAGDTDFAIRLALTFPNRPFVFLDRAMSRYRVTFGSASSTMTNKAFKLYKFLLTLPVKTEAQAMAREDLLHELAHQAVGDQALNRRRVAALRIFFSKYYSARALPARSTYHLALIAFPTIHRLRVALGRMRSF